MTTEKVKRKLTAILSADVKGYSRLIREDEEGTVRTLAAYHEVLASLIRRHRGRVVDSPGDNVLAEFASVVDAVRCAVEVQEDLRARNGEIPDDQKMEYRIGVTLGDVIQKGKKIYGDGVNIAARLESLAEPGGICISGIAYDQVRKKLNLEYQFVGKRSLKNIEEPVYVYRILPVRDATAHRVIKAKVERMAFPLPEKPSIAILPFTNISGDPAQEYLADGISENIITALSKIPEMFVIARNSSFTYKGKPVKIRQVSEELGVQYILEGSVQRVEDRLRITAQLIDALEGHHLWAERYDRHLRDLFALQDEVTMKILTALEVKLTRGEVTREYETEDLEAWGHAVKGYSLYQHYTKPDNAKARKLFEQALELDPDYAFALVMLGRTHIMEARLGWSESAAESLKQAFEFGKKAVALRESEGSGHRLLALVYTQQRQYDMAIAEAERAIALGPNDAEANAFLANALHYAGRFEDAIVHIEKAMRLQPHYPALYLMVLADSYFMVGRYDESLEANKKLLDRAQRGEWPIHAAHLGLAPNYMLLGQEEEAQFHAAEVLRTNPGYSLEAFRSRNPYKDPAHMERFVDPLRKAGIPEK